MLLCQGASPTDFGSTIRISASEWHIWKIQSLPILTLYTLRKNRKWSLGLDINLVISNRVAGCQSNRDRAGARWPGSAIFRKLQNDHSDGLIQMVELTEHGNIITFSSKQLDHLEFLYLLVSTWYQHVPEIIVGQRPVHLKRALLQTIHNSLSFPDCIFLGILHL